MSTTRYALRSAAFAALYLLATLAGLATAPADSGVPLLWPPAVVAALWLVTQARYGRRDLDVIALTVLAVLAPGNGDGIFSDFVQAVPQVVPALLFAWVLDRWLPGYWRGQGNRFRRVAPTLLRLAGVALLAAVSGAVLYKIVDGGLTAGELGYAVLRDATAVSLVIMLARGIRQLIARRRGGTGKQDPSDSPDLSAPVDLPDPSRRATRPHDDDRPGKPGRPHLTIVR